MSQLLPAFRAASCMVKIDFKASDINLESSQAYFAEVTEKPVVGYRSYLPFLWKGALSQMFYTYKKIEKNFFKFQHSLLRMPKFIEIC